MNPLFKAKAPLVSAKIGVHFEVRPTVLSIAKMGARKSEILMAFDKIWPQPEHEFSKPAPPSGGSEEPIPGGSEPRRNQRLRAGRRNLASRFHAQPAPAWVSKPQLTSCPNSASSEIWRNWLISPDWRWVVNFFFFFFLVLPQDWLVKVSGLKKSTVG
jgi:hypothetical protein